MADNAPHQSHCSVHDWQAPTCKKAKFIAKEPRLAVNEICNSSSNFGFSQVTSKARIGFSKISSGLNI
ncbi:MAG: hypothetical protein CMN54_03105 [SAR324 cluster bacterium]|uniref:Uncharacterized protein n=1 Tax=SAR324 cluster bacterium TaxID=2024889 RepID=A0A2D6YGY8_9DELT|nr:hypothetical protein [SAR324 cluster bacterium]